jgi:hypothetical protein
MGAGLAPWVYGFVPFVGIAFAGLVSWYIDIREKSARADRQGQR